MHLITNDKGWEKLDTFISEQNIATKISITSTIQLGQAAEQTKQLIEDDKNAWEE